MNDVDREIAELLSDQGYKGNHWSTDIAAALALASELDIVLTLGRRVEALRVIDGEWRCVVNLDDSGQSIDSATGETPAEAVALVIRAWLKVRKERKA